MQSVIENRLKSLQIFKINIFFAALKLNSTMTTQKLLLLSSEDFTAHSSSPFLDCSTKKEKQNRENLIKPPTKGETKIFKKKFSLKISSNWCSHENFPPLGKVQKCFSQQQEAILYFPCHK